MNVKGRVDWTRKDSSEGHRTYKIKWLCTSGNLLDGPQAAANAPGLPVVGSSWTYGTDNDPSALRTPEVDVQPLKTGEPGYWWTVGHTFTTIPISRCQDDSVENPLLEPPEVSGSFVRYTREAVEDKDGNPLKSSSHEMLRGAAVEVDDSRPTVIITLNDAVLPLATFSPMVDTVNDGSLWGVPKRRVKLSGVGWKRLYYGTCNVYYKISYNFDIRDEGEGFDRKILDEGTKILSAGGSASNPDDFEVYKDANGENTRVLLNGAGAALTNAALPFEKLWELYDESSFLALGIPSTL